LATTVIAAAAIMGGAKYALSQFSSQPSSLVAAIAGLQGSRPATALVAQRQHIILMAVATKSFKVIGSRVAPAPQLGAGGGTSGGGGGGIIYGPPPPVGSLQAIAYKMLPSFGFDAKTQYPCVNAIFTRESSWNPYAANASGAYGIPQALPGSKMATAGPNWQTNPTTQIRWGIGYMKSDYGSPCNAWAFWQAHSWY
jgi:Transglycosylase SLT domain